MTKHFINGVEREICHGADLSDADLRGAVVSPLLLLGQVHWRNLSNDLSLAAMRFDCAMHPDGDVAFARWAAYGNCPFQASTYSRAVCFQERRDLWTPGPAPQPLELLRELLAANGCKHDFGGAR